MRRLRERLRPEIRCAAAVRHRCLSGSGSCSGADRRATRTARAATASGPGRRRCSASELLDVDAAGDLDARPHRDFLHPGHADSHGLLAEIAPAREIALQLVDGGGGAARPLGELRGPARRPRSTPRAVRAASRIPGTTGPGCGSTVVIRSSDPDDDVARPGWSRVGDIEPCRSSFAAPAARARHWPPSEHHGDGVDDGALPERRGLRLVPERQREIDVVVLPARRDL